MVLVAALVMMVPVKAMQKKYQYALSAASALSFSSLTLRSSACLPFNAAVA
jgi:hypothetical protein